ncbi:MAG: amylo-alpha-1,6-glucosidase [Planctomycetota bacterium]
MKRREFLKIAGGGMTLSPWIKELVIAADDITVGTGVSDDRTNPDIRSLFESDREEVLALAEAVFRKCILEKIMPPTPPLENIWVVPGGPYYKGQWIWDTMFVVDLLSIFPGKKKVIRDIFQNYWDFQDRWNSKMPEYAQDMITVAIKTAPQEVRQFSQIPILAWGVERVYRRNGDKQLLEQCLDRLERFHDWYWLERDLTNIGLVTVGSYSGKLQHARWETFDYECNMDDLKLVAHPSRKGPNEGSWYGDICVTGNTSYLIMGERSLAWLAEIAGDHNMASRRKRRIEKAVKAMRDDMWDEEAGTFLSVKRDTLEKIRVATIGSWIPLAAGVPTETMAQRMAEVLASPPWQTPLPIPTVDRTDPRWKSRGFWRGDVWPPTNYQIASGLAAYGHVGLAADICDKTIANAIQNGISEHYDSVSGKPIGVKDYCMSCTLVTMMLDGLTEKYKVKLHDEHRAQ